LAPRTLEARAVILLCAAVFLVPAADAADRQVSAQELVRQGFFSDFDELDLSDLLEGSEETVSVASRRPEPLHETSAPVTLVTAENIRAHGFRTLDDVLRALPGFDIMVDSLGRGRSVARGLPPRLRGGGSPILILLNGHRLNDDLSGGAGAVNLSIPVAGFHHIEVMRGPASAIYGEGAAAAVVNLVTDGPERTNSLAVELGGGSFDQQHAAVEIGSKFGEVWVGGFAMFTDSLGARLDIPADGQTRRDTGAGVPPLSLAPGTSRDDLRTIETMYRLEYRDLSVLWRVKQHKSGAYIGLNDTLGHANQNNSRQFLLDLRYQRKLRVGLLETRLGYTDSKSDELYEAIPTGFRRDLSNGSVLQFPTIFTQTALGTRRVGAEVLYSRPMSADHDLQGGVSLDREWMSPSARSNLDFNTFLPFPAGLDEIPGAVKDVDRNLFGLSLQSTWRTPWDMTVTTAARFDQISDLGGRFSRRLSIVKALRHDLTARALYSRAYRAPSFRDLAVNLEGFAPNPDLESTSVSDVEASLTFHRDDVTVSGTGYLTWLRDPVRAVGLPSISRPTALVNGEGVNVAGFELETRKIVGEHSAFVSYALQSPKDADSGRRSADVPTHMATVGGTYEIKPRLDLSPTLILRSERPRAAGDLRPAVPGYSVMNLTLRRVSASGQLELRAILANVFDNRYRDPAPQNGVPGDYPRPGRSVFFDAKYRF
jgi:iron complex outermembrane receptor protein